MEPHPHIAKGLHGNYPGPLHVYAIGNRKGQATLQCRPNHKDGASLYPFHTKPDENLLSYTVECRALDDLFPDPSKYGDERLLWIDCEGSEMEVLKGGESFIETTDVVNIEMTTKPTGDGWGTPVEIHRWLKEHGFCRQWVHTQRSSAGQVDAIYVRPRLFKPEYCCCPCEIEDHCNRAETTSLQF